MLVVAPRGSRELLAIGDVRKKYLFWNSNAGTLISITGAVAMKYLLWDIL